MPGAPADALIAMIAAEQSGVVSVDELRRLGLSRDVIAHRVRVGRLHRIHTGVYAVGHPNLPLEGLFLAAVKACGPGAFLSHFSAAALWGLVGWEDSRYPEVTVVGKTLRKHPGIRVHRSCSLDPIDTTMRGGIPVTTPIRTLIDLAATTGDRDLRRIVRRAQAHHRVRLGQLARAIARLRPRRGIRKLAEIIASGPAPTRTELEDVVLDLILRGGFRRPEVNVPIRLDGRIIVPDFRWPEQRLIIEADGGAWHDNPLARTEDAERQALLEANGERVLRVTWDQAVRHARQTTERIAAAGAPNASGRSSVA